MKLKKNVLVTVADENRISQAKQLFSSAYFSGGWRDDMLIITTVDLSKKNEKWFFDKGIYVKKFKPVLKNIGFGGYSSNLTLKYYLFSGFLKKWKNVVYLDCDILVNYSINNLTKVKGFAAVRDGVYVKNVFLGKGGFNLGYQFYRTEKFDKKYEIIGGKKYKLNEKSFNSGVMAFSTKEVIKDTTFDRIIDLFKKSEDKLTRYLGDQLVLNLFFYKKWQELSYVFNHSPGHTEYFYGINPEKMDVVITHFLGDFTKPWEKGSDFYSSEFHNKWLRNLNKANLIGNSGPRPKDIELNKVTEIKNAIKLGYYHSLLRFKEIKSAIELFYKSKNLRWSSRLKAWIVNLETIIQILSNNSPKNISTKKTIGVFLLVSNRSFFNALRTIRSLNYYYSGLNYLIIESGNLSRIKKSILKKADVNTRFITQFDILSGSKKFSSCELLRKFTFINPLGKIFITPLVVGDYKKVIILEPGLIFCNYPNGLINWIESSAIKSCSVVKTSKKQNRLKDQKISSPMYCINIVNFFSKNSFLDMNLFIRESEQKIILRKKNTSSENVLTNNFIESHASVKDIFSYTLLRCKASQLSDKCIDLSESKINLNQIKNIKNKIIAVYTSDSETIYNFLILSIFEKLKGIFLKIFWRSS